MKFFIIIFCFFSIAHLTCAQKGSLPKGFVPLFNGRDLSGWHVSRTSHQGTTPGVSVVNGEIVLQQHPYGQGGILLSNKKYKNFELYVEVKVDSFSNGGVFLRSTESGQAYQVELAEPGGTGNLLGEMLRVSKGAVTTNRSKAWKPNDWNSMLIHMTGDTPTVKLWINGQLMWEVTEPANDLIAGVTNGFIGLQSHWSATYTAAAKGFDMSGSWRAGAKHRFRNIGVRELP